MNLEARKLLLIQEFLKIQNEAIIHSLEKFMISTKNEIEYQQATAEKLRATDFFTNTNSSSTITDEHYAELKKMSDLFDKNELKTFSWEEVKENAEKSIKIS